MSKQMPKHEESGSPSAVPPPDPGVPVADVDAELVDRLLERAEREGVDLLGPDGLLSSLTKTVLERALDAELSDHLGYERGDPAGRGSGNSRNGRSGKRVHTDVGTVHIDVPRDRNGTFQPAIVPKGSTRLRGFNDRIIALYARGLTVRDIQAHLGELYGVQVSPDLISTVTNAVLEEVREWQNRPLDQVYAAIYLDAIRCKVRHEGLVVNKAAYLAVGIDADGFKDVLGIWIDATEGAKFWLQICNELKTRGIDDVIFVCCDGLAGLPDAIEAVWPAALVQTCIVHLVRASLRFVSYKDRKRVCAALKEIYRAPNEAAADQALARFDEAWGARYPAVTATWRAAWDRFVPMLAFPPEVRRILYTTNLIESLNYQLRKITRNRGHFPSDEALLKLLYLGVRNHLHRKPAVRTNATNPGLPHTNGWKEALNQFEILWPGRLEPR
jgi:putative transposase